MEEPHPAFGQPDHSPSRRRLSLNPERALARRLANQPGYPDRRERQRLARILLVTGTVNQSNG